MLLPVLALIAGLIVLVWSADRFVDGAAATATHFGMPALLVGMVIIGFGTSAPEIVVSILAAMEGQPDLALGNAYGSNIANIALILGVVAVLSPIAVRSSIVRTEMPLLILATAVALWQLADGALSRADGVVLLTLFAAVMGWSIWRGLRKDGDTLEADMAEEVQSHRMPINSALTWVGIGLLLLILSSRLLVWGAVEIATALGVSELIIGLTIVAIGTSLPELASSLAAVRKNEHDLALGNVIGSNLFNTLIVVGLATVIQPMEVEPAVFQRDAMVMAALTVALLLMCSGFGRPGRLNRLEGAALLTVWVGYTGYLVSVVLMSGAPVEIVSQAPKI